MEVVANKLSFGRFPMLGMYDGLRNTTCAYDANAILTMGFFCDG